MFTFLLVSLALLPLLNAERLRTGFVNDNHDDDLLIQRSIAASYLFGPPIRRHAYHLSDSSVDASSNHGQPRAKRIYWENLAFHAADFNQKPKKL